MKRLLLSIILSIFSLTASAQQVQVQKIAFVPKATGIFNLNASVALNTKSGQSLVVWERVTTSNSDHSIFGRLISNQGKPAGAEFLLVKGPRASHPWVLYNPVKNEFLMSYDDNPTFSLMHSDIYVQRLNAQGKISGASLKVTTDSVSSTLVNYLPRVVFNPKTSNYLLFWLREIINSASVKGNNGMVGVIITPAATPAGSIVVIRPTILDSPRLLQPILLDAVIHPTSGRLLMGHVQHIPGTNAGQLNYYLGSLDAKLIGIADTNFTKINTNPVTVSGFVWGMKMAFQPTGTGFLVFVDNAIMKRRMLDSNGKLSSPSSPAFRSPKNNTKLFYTGLALSNGASGIRGLLIGTQNPFSESGQATLWVQPVDGNGLGLGPAVKVDTMSSTDTAFGSQLLALPQAVTSPTYRFVDFYALTQFTAPGQTFQLSGINLLNLILTFP